jgi:hypothetical protein
MKFSGNSPGNVINTAEGVFFLGIAAVVLVALYKVYSTGSATISSVGTGVTNLLNTISNPLQLINGGAPPPAPKTITDLANVNENGALTAALAEGDPLAWELGATGTGTSGSSGLTPLQTTINVLQNQPSPEASFIDAPVAAGGAGQP